MRYISFMLTPDQILAREKDVTRRMGWHTLQAGQQLGAARKCMGLKRGETIERLATILVTSVRLEPLRRMIDEPDYGRLECVREGFGSDLVLKEPKAFVDFFCASHRGCEPDTPITRIEFSYVDIPGTPAGLRTAKADVERYQQWHLAAYGAAAPLVELEGLLISAHRFEPQLATLFAGQLLAAQGALAAPASLAPVMDCAHG